MITDFGRTNRTFSKIRCHQKKLIMTPFGESSDPESILFPKT